MPDPAPLTSGTVHARLQAAMPSLVPSARRAMEVVLAEPDAVITYAATDLAARAGTAASTVVRACQQAGFKGFQDLKLELTRDLALRSPEPLTHAEGLRETSDVHEVVGAILRASGQALLDAVATVDTGAFAAALEALQAATSVLVVGNGTSSAPAQDTAYRLSILGLSTSAPTDALAQHLAARVLGRGSVCLVVSHTGATRETLLAAETAKSRGAYLVGITSFLRSPLADLADALLVAGSPEQGFRLEAAASRLAHLAVADALFVGLALRDPGRSTTYLDAMADVTAEHSL